MKDISECTILIVDDTETNIILEIQTKVKKTLLGFEITELD